MSRRQLILLVIAALPVVTVAQAASKRPLPQVVVNAQSITPEGEPRQFARQGGYVQWSPRMPVYRGDVLQFEFSLSDGTPVRDVRVYIDGRALARLTRPPWIVKLDTSRLSPGEHVITGDVRTRTQPIMYGKTRMDFNLQRGPRTMVAGSVEETTGAMPEPVTPPVVDPTIKTRLRSLDPEVDRLLTQGMPIVIGRPTTLYLEGNVQRWAYTISRGDVLVTTSGPLAQRVYLQLAPKTDRSPGLLPGELTLKVWGIRNDGVYSPPFEAALRVR